MLQLAIAVLVVILGSALCSGTETALLSISLLKARQLAQSQQRAAVALLNIRKHIHRPIATIVVLNNVFNIIGSIIIGRLAGELLGDTLLGIFSALLTLLIIMFAEIVPKTIGERYAIPIGMAIAGPVTTMTLAFSPLMQLIEFLTKPFTQGKRPPITNEAEIKLLARLGYQEGIIEDDEADMIQRVFQLNDMAASDLMTPRVALTYIPGNAILQDLQTDIIASQHTRILVIEADIDHIAGITLKDELLIALVQGQGHKPVKQFTRPVRFIPEGERADHLLRTFQEARAHLMVVVDEYGGVSGVITLEDVLEVLTGEIVDETDRTVDLQAIARQRRKRLLQSRGLEEV
ncbi:MAG: hemolysin family protein [Cyanobacteria bacterium P01_H01_bin.119]